jgi:hypothetical protein
MHGNWLAAAGHAGAREKAAGLDPLLKASA